MLHSVYMRAFVRFRVHKVANRQVLPFKSCFGGVFNRHY
jgi:hypothetical protein